MARRATAAKSGRTVLVVDDNAEYLATAARLVGREGHEVLTATSGQEALAILRERRVDLMLVDYFMPGMTGEQVVSEARSFDKIVQIVMQTGYASERPPREMLTRLDIQGYHDKSEGPEKLALWVAVGLKAAFHVRALHQSRLGLQYILEVTPELHKMQPIEDLLQGVLFQTAGLLGAVDSFVAVSAEADEDGFVALHQEGALRICAATGRFVKGAPVDRCVPEATLEKLGETLRSGEMPRNLEATLVPLRLGAATLGAIYLDRPVTRPHDAELLVIFANQAAVAIHNSSLFELAAVDSLTRAYTRRFFEHTLLRELRGAYRHGQELSVLLVDVDDLKVLNDEGGHACGDQALELVGRALKSCVRNTDAVGRWGGDELAVVLPATGAEGAMVVTRRLLAKIASLEVTDARGVRRPVRVSVGAAVTGGSAEGFPPREPSYFKQAAQKLVSLADASLYEAKAAGKERVGAARHERWARAADPSDRAGQPAAFGIALLDAHEHKGGAA